LVCVGGLGQRELNLSLDTRPKPSPPRFVDDEPSHDGGSGQGFVLGDLLQGLTFAL
jgi:hypothetical protein